jgi:hypothetical protein
MALKAGSGDCVPAPFSEWPLFAETLIPTFSNSNPLPLGRGCESRVGHHLVDRVPRLGDDKLQVQVGLARDHNGLASGAVWVHRVATRASAPARRDIPVCGHRVKLREIPSAVKRDLVDAIDDQGRPILKEDCSVEGKDVAALDGGAAASVRMGS